MASIAQSSTPFLPKQKFTFEDSLSQPISSTHPTEIEVIAALADPIHKVSALLQHIENGNAKEIPHEVIHSLQVCSLILKKDHEFVINTGNKITKTQELSLGDISFLAEVFSPCLDIPDYQSMVDFDFQINGKVFFLNNDDINRLNLATFMKLLGILRVEKISGVRSKCIYTEGIGIQFLTEMRNNKNNKTDVVIISEKSSVADLVEGGTPIPLVKKKSRIRSILSKALNWVGSRFRDGLNNGIEKIIGYTVLAGAVILFIFVILPVMNPEYKAMLKFLLERISFYIGTYLPGI